MNSEKVVLITVVGMSPAVVTETIWGLHIEHPDLVPDEVKVCTTRTGWEKLESMLLKQKEKMSVWKMLEHKLRKKIKLSKYIFEDDQGCELIDIVTSTDQNLVADQLLRVIRSYKNPELEICRLVASIAGGRKSMSALMYAAMCLGASSDDIITHVLADEKVTSCTEFFFPEQEKQQLINRTGEDFTAAQVKIDLAEIPFVPLVSLVKGADFETGGSFSRLMGRAREHITQLYPEDVKIRISTSDCKVIINGESLELPPRQYMLMAIMAMHALKGKKKGEIMELTYKLANKWRNRLRESNRLPNEILRRWEKEELFKEEAWKDNYPRIFSKEKTYLKQTLENNGYSVVAEDALKPHSPIGFDRIHDIKFQKK